MYCSVCGAHVPDSSEYCSVCGNRLGAPSAAQVAPSQPVFPAQAASAASKKKSRISLIAAVAALVLIGLGVGLFLLFRKGSGASSRGSGWVVVECLTYDASGELKSRETLDEGSSFCVRNYTKTRSDGTVSGRCCETHDANGSLTSTTYYSSDGTVERRREITRKEDGTAVYMIAFYHSDGSLESRYETMNDEHGNPVSIIHYNADGSVKSSVSYDIDYTCGENGTVQTALCHSSDGEDTRIEYSYDGIDRLASVIAYRADGSVVSSRFIDRFEGGAYSETEYTYDSDGSVRSHTESYFDGNNNLISEKRYGRNNRLSQHEECTYDENNNRKTAVYYNEDGTVDGRTEYRWQWLSEP